MSLIAMQGEWEAQNHIETLTENWHMAHVHSKIWRFVHRYVDRVFGISGILFVISRGCRIIGEVSLEPNQSGYVVGICGNSLCGSLETSSHTVFASAMLWSWESDSPQEMNVLLHKTNQLK